MAQAKAHQVKEMIKDFLHHDKTPKQETSPDAAPGYVKGNILPADTTTNIPEVFYPGARPVVPKEAHHKAPYSSALGLSVPGVTNLSFEQAPQQPSAVPSDKADMLGAPPSGKDSERAPTEESTPVAAGEEEQDAAPRGAPSSDDRGTKSQREKIGDESESLPQEKTDESVPANEQNSAEQSITDVDSKDSPTDSLTEEKRQEKSEPATEEKFAELPSTDVDTKERPTSPGNESEQNPEPHTGEEPPQE